MMEFKYSLVLKTLCLTAFYTPLSGLYIPISMFGLLLTYWVDKHLLLRRYQEPPLLSPVINQVLSSYLDYIPLCLALGGIVFKFFTASLRDLPYDLSLDYIVLAISCINFIIPSLSLNKCLFKVDEDVSNHQLYNEARLYFNCEYDRTNPLTKKKAM